MATGLTGRTRPTKIKKQQGSLKRKRDVVDTDKLQAAVDSFDAIVVHKDFLDLPLSAQTRSGLKAGHFNSLTPIQAKAIPLALKGRDILGAAKTGSGKTLAFLVPLLENLYRAQCVGQDAGLCGMVISPTRELAVQIFEVLRKIGGRGHLFSAGLVIGGKNFKSEQDALGKMNIVVCTPGRILQHLSQTVMFNCDNLRMLVLDEADRIMDMGFQQDVDAIVEYLPKDRQTLLFSATQTKRVSDLARLSLRDPEYISTETTAAFATPETLQQNYIVTPLNKKLDTLWSFLQATKKAKIIVFFATGKQVRFVYESFRRLQPGIPLLHIRGRKKENYRMEVVSRFTSAKHACLFATDLIARGIDFPAVDWVVQVDCPDDADTYIHRVGRTARYQRNGRSVLFLDPSEEEGFVSRMAARKVPIERINAREKKQRSIQESLQSMCFKDPELKIIGQTAFVAYARSIQLQKEKDIFKLDRLPLEDFATSLGLPGAPRIKFGKGDAAQRESDRKRRGRPLSDEDYDDESGVEHKPKKVRTKYDRLKERQPQGHLADNGRSAANDWAGDDGDAAKPSNAVSSGQDELFDVKRRIPASDDEDGDSARPMLDGARLVHVDGVKQAIVVDSKRKEKKLSSKKELAKLKDKGTKLVFDDDGRAHPVYEMKDETALISEAPIDAQRRQFIDAEAARVKERDIEDKARAKEKRKMKERKRKEREQEQREGGRSAASDGHDGEVQAVLSSKEAHLDVFASDDDMDGNDHDIAPVPRKWFQRDLPDDGDGLGIAEDAEDLEDLEAMASRTV